MSSTSNVALCLRNHRKKLRIILMQMSPLRGSNETMLNMKPVSGSVGVGDAVADANTGFISGVDPQPISTDFALDVDPPSVKPEFMPEYEASHEDEWAEDSANDLPVLELSNRDKILLQRALMEHAPEVPDYRDLSHVHRVVVDGIRFDDSVPFINHDNVII
jgi:hypothetical protein